MSEIVNRSVTQENTPDGTFTLRVRQEYDDIPDGELEIMIAHDRALFISKYSGGNGRPTIGIEELEHFIADYKKFHEGADK